MGHITLTGLDPERCAARNRIAARKGFEAVPLKFLRAPSPVGSGVTSAVGSLPADDAEALDRINAMLDNGNEPLTLDDIYIHYAEAANTNFIPDRYAFMSRRTLKNIATDAAAGFAFMNSHRTGGLSSPAELPYGRTFAGRYENMAATESEPAGERAIIGFYMLKGVYPNGEQGPSTDAMSAGIKAGTIFDVSVGLYGGQMLCDVCGGDMADWYGDCDHYPGTTYHMTDEEIQAQADKGVPGGCCSYTMDDCHCGETSAVFDGAVPGAGFRKMLHGEKIGVLTGKSRAQARLAFAPLLSKGDTMDINSIKETIQEAVTSAFRAVGLGNASHKGTKAQRNAGNFSAGAEEDTELDDETKTAEQDTAEKTTEAKPEDTDAPAEDPVLTAAHQAGIHTVEQFQALQERAKSGDAYLATQREEAKKLAVVAFGNDEAAKVDVDQAHAFLETAPLSQVQSLAAQYKRLAVKQKLQTEDGKPMERKSQPADLPEFANDVAQPKPDAPGVVLKPASAVYAERKKVMQGK